MSEVSVRSGLSLSSLRLRSVLCLALCVVVSACSPVGVISTVWRDLDAHGAWTGPRSLHTVEMTSFYVEMTSFEQTAMKTAVPRQ